MWPAHGNRSIVFGSMLSMTMALVSAPRTMRARGDLPTPTRHSSASSRFASVAESAQVTRPGRAPRRRARASSVCTPRFDESNSCHSSTTIAASPRKRSRQSARARNSVRLSGVVTSTVGNRLPCRARAPAVVSPVRTSTDQCGRSAAAAVVNARPVSAARARSGVIQSSVRGGGASAPPSGPRTIGGIAAASVLPMPVGACRSPDSPRAQADQTSSWNANGVIPRAANQACAGANGSGSTPGVAATPSAKTSSRRCRDKATFTV